MHRLMIWCLCLSLLAGCASAPEEAEMTMVPAGEYGGSDAKDFKVPVPPGYHWQVTQSWKSHCGMCAKKYPFWDYCSLSHMGGCCAYSWDFNLPGVADKGKPVLATGEGTVKKVGYTSGWGNYVVLDHGNNICSRYAHMVNDSTDHLSEGQGVCQGLKLGTIGDTGYAEGAHLHFQFEECSSGKTLQIGFTDGNGVPVCTQGKDIYDAQGKYNFLTLTNTMKESCKDSGSAFGEAVLPKKGWLFSSCGSFPGCPLIVNCSHSTDHTFKDGSSMDKSVSLAASYLYSECAVDGKSDGKFHSKDLITRAEALKISMHLFGIMDGCGSSKDAGFADVKSGDWFYKLVNCAAKKGIASTDSSTFNPNKTINFAEAAKFAVLPAVKAGVIQMQTPKNGHFANIPSGHWAYPYVETLHAYGGVPKSLIKGDLSATVTRGEYALMTSALSPCYCGNVQCTSGCECAQEFYACMDPDAPALNLGGSSKESSDDVDEEERLIKETEEYDPHNTDEPDEIEFLDLSFYCVSKDFLCVGDEVLFGVKCSVHNPGNTDVKIKNVEMFLMEQSDKGICTVSESTMNSGEGAGYLLAPSHASVTLNGTFQVTCTQFPSDMSLKASFDLWDKSSGSTVWYPKVATTEVMIAEPFEAICGEMAEPSVPSGPSVPSDLGFCEGIYTLDIDAPDAVSFYMTPSVPQSAPFFGSGSLSFDCKTMLPAAVLIEGGSMPVLVQTYYKNPPFMVFANYKGPLTVTPVPYRLPGMLSAYHGCGPTDCRLLVVIPPPD